MASVQMRLDTNVYQN